MNVVFDLGGVLLICDPPALVSSLFYEPVERVLILDGVFGDADWVAFDRGTITRRVVVDHAVERTGIDRHRLEMLFDALPGALVPAGSRRARQSAEFRGGIDYSRFRTCTLRRSLILRADISSSLSSKAASFPVRLAFASRNWPSTHGCSKLRARSQRNCLYR